MSNQATATPPGSGQSSAEGRLDSWKEIAAYLRREVRTVQRWENEPRFDPLRSDPRFQNLLRGLNLPQ